MFRPLNSTSGFSISTFELCDLEGFTIITCSSATIDLDIREPDDPIRLINGMIFKPIALGPLLLSGGRVVVLGTMVEIKGEKHILYKLITEMDDMVYDVFRIR